MGNKFKKFKGKYLLGAILKSAICGVASGLFAAGVVLLALKLGAVNLAALYSAIAGVVAALVGGGVVFVFLRPNDKKVAENLDKRYALEERMQTSLEFAGQSGTIVELQREDADSKLAAIGTSGASIVFSKIWQFIIALAVAAVMVVTAILIPARVVSGEEPGLSDDDPAEITEIQVLRTEELIENVKASNLDGTVKESVAAELEEFLEIITEGRESGITRGQLIGAIVSTVEDVDDIISQSTTYLQIASALSRRNQYTLAQAVTAGGSSYRYVTLKEYEQVKSFHGDRWETTIKAISDYVDNLQKYLCEDEDSFKTRLETATAETAAAILLSGIEDTSDSLYAALSGFATAMDGVVQSADGGADFETLTAELDGVFSDAITTLTNALCPQTYAGAMGRFTGNRLKIIFAELGFKPIEAESPPDDGSGDTPGTPPTDTPPPDDETPGGNTQRPFDGQIWDPEMGIWRDYDEVVRDYYGKVLEALRSGNLTEEQKQAIENYFQMLLGGDLTDGQE